MAHRKPILELPHRVSHPFSQTDYPWLFQYSLPQALDEPIPVLIEIAQIWSVQFIAIDWRNNKEKMSFPLVHVKMMRTSTLCHILEIICVNHTFEGFVSLVLQEGYRMTIWAIKRPAFFPHLFIMASVNSILYLFLYAFFIRTVSSWYDYEIIISFIC